MAPASPAPRWPAWLTFRWCVPALALLGMLMAAPVIPSGLILDDFLHGSTMTEGARAPRHPGSPWGLFHFVTGDVAQNQALKATGELMWWTADELRLAFWRPLAEWTHGLDYRLWPDSPALMHLHNLLWLGALILLLARLYQALDTRSPARARLGVLFFVLSGMHVSTVAWIAARNQLIAACFTVVCVGAFHAWRARGSARHGALALAAFALSLLSAEAGLATLGYLAAHVAVHGAPRGVPQGWARRLLALAPFLAMVVAWRLAYNAMGYGSAASGFYIDPAADPGRFLQALALRLPSLLVALIYCVPAPTLGLVDAPFQPLYAFGAACLALLAGLVAHAYGVWRNPVARFLALGAVLALVPLCACEPSDRLLLPSELGMSLVLAMLLARMWTRHRLHRGGPALAAKVLIGVAMAAHLVISPLQAVALAPLRLALGREALRDPLSLPDARLDADARVVLLNPPIASMATYYPAMRRHHGLRNPASMHALANGLRGLTVGTLDAHTLTLHEPSGKGFIDGFARDARTHPFTPGQPSRVGPMRVTVTALSPQGTPVAVRFRFDDRLDAASLHLYIWTDDGFVRFVPPPVGGRIALPAPDLGRAVRRAILGRAAR